MGRPEAELEQLRQSRQVVAVEPDFSDIEAPANMMDPNLAIQFTRWDDLTEEQQELVTELGRRGQTIVREQGRSVVGHGLLRPRDVNYRSQPLSRSSSIVTTSYEPGRSKEYALEQMTLTRNARMSGTAFMTNFRTRTDTRRHGFDGLSIIARWLEILKPRLDGQR